MNLRLLLVPALGGLLISALPAQTQENCFDYCLRAGGTGDCAVRCGPGGDLENAHPWVMGKSWGAIAYSQKDKGVGWSHGYAELAKAKKVALDRCSDTGKTCKLWIWYADSCGALAVDGRIVTWGTSSTRKNANQRALDECAKAGGRKCTVQVSQCSK
ncbi:MAG TPA: DUF4189 domain-containing protein [Bryobacteraceae bacterium]